MDIILKFDKDVFNVEEQARGLSAESAPFSKQISDMNAEVEVLDRYDDFSELKIDSSTYEKRGGKYGIPRADSEIHKGGSVILQHQQKAAKTFLSSLRGFGLLADVVGSGKTFEACVALSELAVRGNVRSVLIVAPGQVYDTWVEVLERKFGLGEGNICHAATRGEWAERERRAKDEGVRLKKRYPKQVTVDDLTSATEEIEGFVCPKEKVWLAAWEDFTVWREDVAGMLFDVIVVDEAHHLCEERGGSARALRLLAMMMEVKKRANRSYCILLSATPHSGNLDQMFRLWYFIRCKGGNPSDYDEKDESARTEEYRKEKKYYHDYICHGATTVAEFIKKVKVDTVTLETSSYRAAFERYLDERRSGRRGENIPDVDEMTEAEKLHYVEDFLKGDPDTDIEVIKSVSSAYHDGVLRSIMIRQPNHIHKTKTIKNIFFFPSDRTSGNLKFKYEGREVTVNVGALGGDRAVSCDGDEMSLRAYSSKYCLSEQGNGDEGGFYSEFVMAILRKLGVTDPSDGTKNPTFRKADSVRYYKLLLHDCPKEIGNEFCPVPTGADVSYSCKLERLKRILREHGKDRVIVFFDYDLDKKDRVDGRVLDDLRAEPDLAPRILVGDRQDKEVTGAFMKKNDAVLIVRSADFTEGANLQMCNLIVNFQVTPDPLAMDQRIGRIFRIGQDKDVTVYSLADMRELEGYVLMYFSRIGLLDSSSGDATILAGSNNERMVTIRCPVCGNVRLMSLEKYEDEKRKDNDEIYCRNTVIDHPDAVNGRTRMNEISVYDFKCDTCDRTFTRSVVEEGYFCMSSSNSEKGVMHESYTDRMCNSGERGDRTVYCRKICAIAHCSRFTSGDMKGKCAALARYREDRNVSEAELMLYCERCPEIERCGDCRVQEGPEAIDRCARICSSDLPQCRPRPHLLSFNDKWEAKCPACAAARRRGTIKPVQTRTFATFIRGAWNYRYDGGKAFCNNLEQEAEKVGEIKDILKHDEEGEYGTDR